MSWIIQEKIENEAVTAVVIVNDDPEAGQSSDYREADTLARTVIKGAKLKHKGYLNDGTATRIYA